jgi:hypothetical protein
MLCCTYRYSYGLVQAPGVRRFGGLKTFDEESECNQEFLLLLIRSLMRGSDTRGSRGAWADRRISARPSEGIRG